MTKQNQDLLLSFVDRVWNNGDLDAIEDFVSDKYTIHHDPGDPWEKHTLTRSGLRERVQTSRAPVPDQTFDIQSVFSDQDSVCITWLWHGTHLGEIAGINPTGKVLRMSGATVYYFDNCRITGHWQITDRLSIYQQLMEGRE